MVTPEYNGSASPILTNAFAWASRPWGAGALKHKRVAILAANPSPRAAQWAREDVVKQCSVIGAEAITPTIGIGRADAMIVNGRITDTDIRQEIQEMLISLGLVIAGAESRPRHLYDAGKRVPAKQRHTAQRPDRVARLARPADRNLPWSTPVPRRSTTAGWSSVNPTW